MLHDAVSFGRLRAARKLSHKAGAARLSAKARPENAAAPSAPSGVSRTCWANAMAMTARVASAVATLAVIAIAFAQQVRETPDGALGAAAFSGLAFALSLAAPALWLSFLAALSRPKDTASWSIVTGAGRAFARDYYPLERLLAYAVAISATIAVVATVIVSSRHGGFDAALNRADEA